MAARRGRDRSAVAPWWKAWRRGDLPHDLFAGLMGTISTVPEAMAFALLAGLPAHMGLYALFLPILAYFLLGTSRDLSLSPTAPVVALLASTVVPIAGDDPDRYVAVALLVSWLAGGILLAAGLLRLGYAASFVSRPVLDGYFAGASLLIAASQVPLLLGLNGGGLDVAEIARSLAAGWGELEPGEVALGAGLLALLYLLHAAGLRAIGPGVAVAAGAAAVGLLGLQAPVVGAIPAGLPDLHLPAIGGGAVARALPGAAAIALVAFLDSVSTARAFAGQNGYRIDPDRELLALGAANVAAGASGAAPVSGNLADTLLLEEAGARTPVTTLVTVALVLVLLLAGADFPRIPLAAFAAIVVHAVVRPGLFAALRRTFAEDRVEFAAGLLCLAGVLTIGLVRGLLIAMGLTVLRMLALANHLPLRTYGVVRDPAPALVDPDGGGRPVDTLLFQPLGGLFFASAGSVVDRMRARIARAPALRRVVIDLRAVPWVDLTACDYLAALARELAARDVALLAVRVRAEVAERFRRCGLGDLLAAEAELSHLLDG